MPYFPQDWDGGKCGERVKFGLPVVFPFLPAFLILGEDVRLAPYQRECRFGGHWTGVYFFR